MKNNVLILLVLSFFMMLPAHAEKKKVNTVKSTIIWTGKKVTGQHHGSVQLESGWFKIEDNKIVDGNFVIDMKSIIDDDQEGDMKAKLEKHLKSDDFFGVEKHPTSTLKITGSDAINAIGFNISGDLTIKGITHPVNFKAKEIDGKYIATLVVDRSKYDVRYRSASFFDNLGDKVIYDDFTLEIVLYTN